MDLSLALPYYEDRNVYYYSQEMTLASKYWIIVSLIIHGHPGIQE